jgi:uncharacterized caspase-like protein/tetratricopeptide (TPR) repeat protein
MKHNACITIGINQYHFVQPLSYAQEDAEALQNFLHTEANFSSDGCLLLTDSSPEKWGHSTYPSRENILQQLDAVCSEHIEPGEILWCFFSGYGINYEGQDYLLPIDGNPSDIVGTGIAVRSLLETLKKAPTETVLLLLDINRSQGANAGAPVGDHTAQLARELEIPTILSCHPNQVSRETSALRHGFFTAALLEGLRSGKCNTLKSLEGFLRDRVPQLSEHHLRPRQEPVAVINPVGKIHQVILPDSLATVESEVSSVSEVSPVHEQNGVALGVTTANLQDSHTIGFDDQDSSSGGGIATLSRPTSASEEVSEEMVSKNGKDQTPVVPSAPEEESGSDRSFLQHLLIWSLGTAVVLLFGVFFINRDVFITKENGKKSQKMANTEKVQKSVPAYPPQTEKKSSQGAVAPTESKIQEKPMDTSSPVSPVTPTSAAKDTPKPVSNTPNTDKENSNLSSQGLLDQSRLLLKDNSASSYNKAINIVRRIPPSDPLYPDAQSNIERWSKNILEIAQSRANSGNFQSAINAAKLVPNLNESIYTQAQDAIAQWENSAKREQANNESLKKAQGKITRGLASSYNQAIELAGQVKPTDPKYAQSQQLIREWSDVIFKIAQLRASQGRYPQAVEAAKLVPPNTPSYQDAQNAIVEWKSKK